MFDTMHRIDFATRAPAVSDWPARVAKRLDAIADPRFSAADDLAIITAQASGKPCPQGMHARALRLISCAMVAGNVNLDAQAALLRECKARAV